MSTAELLWRAFGPIWATGVMLVVAFPGTVVAFGLVVWGATRATARDVPIRLTVRPGLVAVALLWVWAALFRSDHPGPAPAVRTAGVAGLLGLYLVLAVAVARRLQWRGPAVAWLLAQLWVSLVAAFIALWWVEGWASL